MSTNVLLVGANPIVRLFDGDHVSVFVSVWVVDWSRHGRGCVLVLWHDGRVRVIGANVALAEWLAEDFTRHFPEAHGLAWRRDAVEPTPVTVDLDLFSGLRVLAGDVMVDAAGILDHRSFATDAFELDGRELGLSLVMVPVSAASVSIGGEPLAGGVRLDGPTERPSSSAFLTAAEVWTAPPG